MDELARYEDIDDLDYLPEDPEFNPTSSASLYATPASSLKEQSFNEAELRRQIRNWICIYPIYFDKTKSKFPRRVPIHLAQEEVSVEVIAKVLQDLMLPCVVEPNKIHPQDPLRPGRIRTVLPKSFSRRALFRQIGERLQPTLPAITASASSSKPPQKVPGRPNTNTKLKK